MKQWGKWVLWLFLFSNEMAHGHGFGKGTLVHCEHGDTQSKKCIKRVCKRALRKKTKVVTRDINRGLCQGCEIKSVARSYANACVIVHVEGEMNRDVVCGGKQEFYVLEKNAWVAAKDLVIGDLLASRDGIGKRVTLIEMLAVRTKVYHLYLEKQHTFFVGRHGLLAHNMFLPAVQLGLGLAFGSGATAGGVAGSFLGPLVLTGGIALSGLAGIAIGGLAGIIGKVCFGNRKIPWIEMELDASMLQELSEHAYDGKQKRTSKKNDQSGKNDNNNNNEPDKEKDNKRNTDPEKPKDWKRLTNEEAREKAKKADYHEVKDHPAGINTHGAPLFKSNCGNYWISPDKDGHNGGFWKLFDTQKRIGTLDAFFKIIKG